MTRAIDPVSVLVSIVMFALALFVGGCYEDIHYPLPSMDAATEARDAEEARDLATGCVVCEGAPLCSLHCCGIWPACEKTDMISP